MNAVAARLMIVAVLAGLCLTAIRDRVEAAPFLGPTGAVLPNPGPYLGSSLSENDDTGLARLRGLGAGWVKFNVDWQALEPSQGNYQWSYLDDLVDRAARWGFRVLWRVNDAPDWAADPACGGGIAQPPAAAHYVSFQTFLQTAAARYRGRIHAYEIWNEQNTRIEWGGCNPNAAQYLALLRRAWAGIKAADPNAYVITGGLSNTGNGATNAAGQFVCDGTQNGVCGDLVFFQALLQAGGRPGNDWDAIGHHPYGGTCSPTSASDTDPCRTHGLWFRRVEDFVNVYRDFGRAGVSGLVPRTVADEARAAAVARERAQAQFIPIPRFYLWATEWGWLFNQYLANCNLGSKNAEQVTSTQMGDYSVGAWLYARLFYPQYFGPMFMLLIDYNIGQPNDCEMVSPAKPIREFRWYSLFNTDGSVNYAGINMSLYGNGNPYAYGGVIYNRPGSCPEHWALFWPEIDLAFRGLPTGSGHPLLVSGGQIVAATRPEVVIQGGSTTAPAIFGAYRAARDGYYQSSPAGQAFMRLHDLLAPGVTTLVRDDSALAAQVASLLANLAPEIRSLVLGTSASVTLTTADVNQLNAVLDAIQPRLQPSAAGTLAAARAAWNLNGQPGKTVGQAAADIAAASAGLTTARNAPSLFRLVSGGW